MKHWRPDGWDALDIYAAAEHIGMTGTDLVEAGADAILEAIRKGGARYHHPFDMLSVEIPRDKAQAGWLIFIPEE